MRKGAIMNFEILNGYLITPSNEGFKVEKDIFVEDGKISFKRNLDKYDKTINVKNKIIMPGLVNAHHHIYSTLSKGVPCEVPFNDFEGSLKNLWWTLDRSLLEDDMKLSTAITMKDCIKNGVTTVFDHHISASYIENSLSMMAEVFDNYGISGTVAFETSDRNGEEIFKKSVDENVRFAKKNKGKSVQGMIGLHASFTLSDESLKYIADTSEDFPIHVHVAEGEVDEIQAQEKHGKSVIERYNELGLIRKNSLIIHCSNLNEKEIEILKAKDIFIAQAVDSNMNNALNVGNIYDFIKNDIKTTVGTDGMTSNIMKAYKNSYIFTKYLNQTPDIGYPEMYSLIMNSYELKKRFGFPLGVIEGESADLAIFDYEPATPFNSEQFLGHFIFGITESFAQYVIKKDEILLDDYHVTKDLYKDLFERSEEISKAMFKRFEDNK